MELNFREGRRLFHPFAAPVLKDTAQYPGRCETKEQARADKNDRADVRELIYMYNEENIYKK